MWEVPLGQTPLIEGGLNPWKVAGTVWLSILTDLCSFVLALLAERRQQHDAAVLREPVGDPPCRRSQGEPQF